jgi:hypothetical protein
MTKIDGPGHDETSRDSTYAKTMQRLSAFLSSKFSLLVFGALFTAIGTVWLPAHLSKIDKDEQQNQHDLDMARQENQHKLDMARDAKTALLKKNEDHAEQIRKLVDDAILRRLVYSDLLLQHLSVGESGSVMAASWSNYWDSYRDYFLFRRGNEIPIDRDVDVNSEALDKNPSVLWTYLDYVIDEEFDRVHNCLIKAQSVGYVPSMNSQQSHSLAAGNCGQAANLPFFMEKGTGVRPDPWRRFKICVGTFVLQVEYSLRFRQQLAAEENPAPDPSFDVKKCPAGYAGNAICRQLQFNSDLKDSMKVDCGPLPPNVQPGD